MPDRTLGSQEWIDKHMAVAHELAIKSANSVLPGSSAATASPQGPHRDDVLDDGEECDACGC